MTERVFKADKLWLSVPRYLPLSGTKKQPGWEPYRNEYELVLLQRPDVLELSVRGQDAQIRLTFSLLPGQPAESIESTAPRLQYSPGGQSIQFRFPSQHPDHTEEAERFQLKLSTAAVIPEIVAIASRFLVCVDQSDTTSSSRKAKGFTKSLGACESQPAASRPLGQEWPSRKRKLAEAESQPPESLQQRSQSTPLRESSGSPLIRTIDKSIPGSTSASHPSPESPDAGSRKQAKIADGVAQKRKTADESAAVRSNYASRNASLIESLKAGYTEPPDDRSPTAAPSKAATAALTVEPANTNIQSPERAMDGSSVTESGSQSWLRWSPPDIQTQPVRSPETRPTVPCATLVDLTNSQERPIPSLDKPSTPDTGRTGMGNLDLVLMGWRDDDDLALLNAKYPPLTMGPESPHCDDDDDLSDAKDDLDLLRASPNFDQGSIRGTTISDLGGIFYNPGPWSSADLDSVHAAGYSRHFTSRQIGTRSVTGRSQARSEPYQDGSQAHHLSDQRLTSHRPDPAGLLTQFTPNDCSLGEELAGSPSGPFADGSGYCSATHPKTLLALPTHEGEEDDDDDLDD